MSWGSVAHMPRKRPDNKPPTGPRLLTIDETAAQLGQSRATVYRLVNGGDLASVHVGEAGFTRIAQTDLDTYITHAYPLLKIDDVADRLRITRRTVYRMIAAGDLPTVGPKGEQRVKQADFDRYIAKHRVTPKRRKAA